MNEHDQGQMIYDMLKNEWMTTAQIAKAMGMSKEAVMHVMKAYEGCAWERKNKVHPTYHQWLTYWAPL